MKEVEDYCLARSRRLRTRPDDSRLLVRLAAAYLPASGQAEPKAVRQRIQAMLQRVVRQRYGNPVVVWLLLNVIVPVVVRLVVEWWLNRKD